MCKPIHKSANAVFFLFPFISNVGWYKCSLGGVHFILQCSTSPLSSGSRMLVKEPQGCPGLLLHVWLIQVSPAVTIASLFLGLCLLEDDTIHLQIDPSLRLLTYGP